MKLLESGRLEALSSCLTNLEIEAEWRVIGRVESYSCKVAGGEQKSLYKKMAKDGGGAEIVALSPPLKDNFLSKSTDSEAEITSENWEMFVISRKMLFNLISTLNLSFHPDYDFSDAKSHEFSRTPSLAHVWAEIDSRLGQCTAYHRSLRQRLWDEIDSEIGGLRDSEVYTYKPDLISDPFSESGCVWSFNFFFHNLKLKRIVFLTCRAISPNSSASEESEFSMED